MLLVVESLEDEASINICARLRELAKWDEVGQEFEGHPILRSGRFLLATLSGLHLRYDHVDEKIRRILEGTSLDFSSMIFASKHKSAAGVRALTCHPIGNFGEAEAGGVSGELSIAPVSLLSPALRVMRRLAVDEAFAGDVTFEVTHHGPFVQTPAMFIEVGSGPNQWGDADAARIVAQTILTLDDSPPMHPIAVGVGGGHYAPRQADVALKRRIAFGHLVPNYALDAHGAAAIANAIDRTPGCTSLYVDRKSISGKMNREVQAVSEAKKVRIVKSEALDPL